MLVTMFLHEANKQLTTWGLVASLPVREAWYACHPAFSKNVSCAEGKIESITAAAGAQGTCEELQPAG